MSTCAKPDVVDHLGASSTLSRLVRDDSGESVVSHQSGDVDSGSEASAVADIRATASEPGPVQPRG
jgi:hypothetical protein